MPSVVAILIRRLTPLRLLMQLTENSKNLDDNARASTVKVRNGSPDHVSQMRFGKRVQTHGAFAAKLKAVEPPPRATCTDIHFTFKTFWGLPSCTSSGSSCYPISFPGNVKMFRKHSHRRTRILKTSPLLRTVWFLQDLW